MTGADVNLFNIERSSFVDGPGIRTVVFFKGCGLRCRWCHNPESWSAEKCVLWFENRCLKCGLCASACPRGAIRADFSIDREKCAACGKCVGICPNGARREYGRHMSPRELLGIIKTDKPFYDTSGGGVTFSGGECMLQIDALDELTGLCAENGISVAVDTAGDVPRESFERIIDRVDWFLYDIKCMDPSLHREMTGADNGRILSNYRYIHGRKPGSLIVRIPLIPGVNDSAEELHAMKELLSAFPPVRIDVLPYHRMGEAKQQALGRGSVFSVPEDERLKKIQAEFEALVSGRS